MGYQLSWLVEDRVMFCYVSGVMTRDDMVLLIDDVATRIRNGKPPVHYIGDSTQLEKLDLTVRDIHLLFRFIRRPPESGWNLDVTTNRFTRFVGGIASHLAGIRYRQMNSIEDAITYLQQADLTLPEIPMPHPTDASPTSA